MAASSSSGIAQPGDSLMTERSPSKTNFKLINDPIHGHMKIHPACVAIIDTPQFQRLRYIKQLGMCYFVYPGAAHNRFEHSLGVSYLAGKFARSLKKCQPELGINDKDILCVEIAGLCHDLGHGPFSHMFDGMFVPAIGKRDKKKAWKHEDASLSMFDHLIKENRLMEEGSVLRHYGLTDKDLIFIKELFAGPPRHGTLPWPYEGRGVEKSFLYEIVSNKRNGIDVDKWDYFARDCHHLGLSNNFDHSRYIKLARVLRNGDMLQICTRDKERWNLYNMYLARYSLHRHAYQHRVNCGLEFMVRDALLEADEHMKISGTNGLKHKISECHKDMEAYSLLTDNIIFIILNTDSKAPGMKKAKELIKRIFSRKIYSGVFESRPFQPDKLQERDEDTVMAEILNLADWPVDQQCRKEDFFVQFVKLDFGMGSINPLEKLGLYSKDSPDDVFYCTSDEACRLLTPLEFNEINLRVFCKDIRQLGHGKSVIMQACKDWCEKNGITQSSPEQASTQPLSN